MKASAPPPRLTEWVMKWGVGVVAVLLGALLLFVFVHSAVAVLSMGDVGLYRWWGEAISRGAIPYRDVPIEYPPGAVPLFLLPALVTGSLSTYSIAFGGVVGSAGAVALVLAARTGTMLAPATPAWALRTLAAALMIGLLASVALTRFDLVPAALTVAALYALTNERRSWAGVLLGAAIAVKVYPVVVVPVAATYIWQRGGLRSAAAFGAPMAAVLGLAFLPFVLVAPDGIGQSLSGQLQRPLHVESVGASILWLAHEAGITSWPVQPTYFNLSFPHADLVAASSTVLGLGVLLYLWSRHARREAGAHSLIQYSFASVAVFVVFAKVLSPQFLIWLVVMVPALRGTRANVTVALLLGAVAATALYFPRGFVAAVTSLDPLWLNMILARNVLLAAMVLVLVAPWIWRSVTSR